MIKQTNQIGKTKYRAVSVAANKAEKQRKTPEIVLPR
jgi:hypothetical protein